VEYNNKEKLKEKNDSRLTEPDSGLTVTKGKGTGQGGWEDRNKGGEKKGVIRITMYNVWSGGSLGGLYNT